MVQSALDLNVWKELAISKQMLIRTATDALDLDPKCSEEEFKTALLDGINKISKAESLVSEAKVENQAVLDKIAAELAATEKARVALETAHNELLAEKSALEALIETNRKTSAKELAKASAQVDEKNKVLKKIKVTLADSPENVVKKLKALNKKKLDETNARKRAEDELRSLKKDSKGLQKTVTEQESSLEDSAKLVDQYKELRTFSEDQYTQLKPLVEDETQLTSLPDLDEALLKSLAKETEETEES